jgi:hypothetical protein
LKADSNTLVLTNASDGGCDIEWPGIQVLAQFTAAPTVTGNVPARERNDLRHAESKAPHSPVAAQGLKVSVDGRTARAGETMSGTRCLIVGGATGREKARRVIVK